MGIIIIAAVALIVRLFIIQVVKDTYRLSADNNVLRYVTQYPARGLIYDRKGNLIVFNQAAYDLMVVPAQTAKLDTLAFCNDLGINIDVFRERLKAARNYSRRAPSVFLKQISAETYAKFQEKLFMYPGFYVQPRTLRKYSRPVAAHLLGYVSEVDESLIKKDPYYKTGDYIGKLGIEEAYEKDLRGKRGVKIFMVDVYSRIKGSYANGAMDTVAVHGSDIISGLDLYLQEYGEHLMQNKTGSIVAIEPETGEILALVSSPNYDPGLLVGRARSENFARLQADTIFKPLFNRAFMASYPPGSTFKPIVMASALDAGLITPQTKCNICSGPVTVSGYDLHTWNDKYYKDSNMLEVIQHSDNTGMVFVAQKLGADRMINYLTKFGIGELTEIDLQGEIAPALKTRSAWYAVDLATTGFGQGISITPIELLTAFSALANEGKIMKPRIVTAFENSSGEVFKMPTRISNIPISAKTAKVMTEILVNAVEKGEAQWTKLKGYRIAGKTGTASIPVKGHYDPNSTIASFIGFAPAEKPKFIMLVILEKPTASIYAADTAAPVFFDIAHDLLNYYGIPPSE